MYSNCVTKLKSSIIDIPAEAGFYLLYKNTYWLCTKDEEVLLNRHGSPMCNSDKRILEKFLNKTKKFPDCRIIFLENAWLDHDCHDYV